MQILIPTDQVEVKSIQIRPDSGLQITDDDTNTGQLW